MSHSGNIGRKTIYCEGCSSFVQVSDTYRFYLRGDRNEFYLKYTPKSRINTRYSTSTRRGFNEYMRVYKRNRYHELKKRNEKVQVST